MALRDAKYVKDFLGVKTEARVYELARLGILPPGVVVRMGRQIRFDEDALQEWIRKGGSIQLNKGKNGHGTLP